MRQTRAIALQAPLVLGLLLIVVRFSAAQPAAGCVAPDCPLPSDQVRATKAGIDQLKRQFVAAVGQLAVVMTSPSSDGLAVRSSIESLGEALNRWDAAIEAFEGVLLPRPPSAESRLALGTVYLDRRRLDVALRELDDSARRDAGRADVHLLMARALEDAGRLTEALGVLLRASVAETEDPMTRYELARLRSKLGQEKEARDELSGFRAAAEKRVLESRSKEAASAPIERTTLLPPRLDDEPTFAPASYSSSFASLERGALEESVRGFRQAAALDPLVADPSDASDSLSQGRSALRRGELPSALKHLKDAVQSAPGRAEAHRVLGTAYWVDGQLDLSVDEFSAAILANPSDERSWTALSEVLAGGGRLTEAERLLREAVKLFPQSGLAHYNLGRLHNAVGNYVEGARALEDAAKRNVVGGRDALYEMIGKVYVGLADFDHAAEAFTKVIGGNRRSADAHQKLGEARVRQDRYPEALAEFLATLLIDPQRSDAYGAAAQVYLRTGRYAKAAEMARHAVELDPALKDARYAFGTALMRLGRSDEGSRQLDEFRRLQEQAAVNDRRKFELERLKRDAAASLANADYEKAAGLLRQAVTYESAAPTFLALGFTLMEADRHSEAVVNLQKALELQAGPDAHRYLAEAYRALGRLDDSRMEQELYRQAMEELKRERLRKMNDGL